MLSSLLTVLGNWLGIIARGFLDPKTVLSLGVNRTDEGYLGNGIYFSPDPLTAAKYSSKGNRFTRYHSTFAGARGSRIIAAASVALGNVKDFHCYSPGLHSPPLNYHSCHGCKRTNLLKSDFEDEE